MGLERKVLTQAIHLSADANLLHKQVLGIQGRKRPRATARRGAGATAGQPSPAAARARRQHGASPAMDAAAGAQPGACELSLPRRGELAAAHGQRRARRPWTPPAREG